MSAVEEIEAAIAKLTKLRDEGTGGPWTNEYGDLDGANLAPVCDMEVQCGSYCQGGTAPGLSDANADLIVTLHATIDAQLLILQDFYERYSDKPLYSADWVPKAPSARNALALARSINATS